MDSKLEEEIVPKKEVKSNKYDTESDHELNEEGKDLLKEREIKVKSVNQVKLNIPKVLKDQGLPYEQIPSQKSPHSLSIKLAQAQEKQ